jgi:hypothetical protein
MLSVVLSGGDDRIAERQLKSDDGRRQFMAWLFRIADVDHTEKVTAAGLLPVIQAIQRDGVHLDEFPHPDPQHCVEDILQHLDVSGRGYLDRDAFSILEDIIIKHYHKKSQEWTLRTISLSLSLSLFLSFSLSLSLSLSLFLPCCHIFCSVVFLTSDRTIRRRAEVGAGSSGCCSLGC